LLLTIEQVEYKSQPIPEEPKEGGVTIVVGKTVDAIVFDDSKDVLLEVYAPWCGHCKKLEPIYKKLAKRFAKVLGTADEMLFVGKHHCCSNRQAVDG
jgi:thiol-disulfide isomerase/thioredoxin